MLTKLFYLMHANFSKRIYINLDISKKYNLLIVKYLLIRLVASNALDKNLKLKSLIRIN